MTKKEIWATLVIFMAVFIGVGAGLFVLTRNTNAKQTNNTDSLSNANNSQAQARAMTLNGASSAQNTNDNSLTVVAGANNANPAQLGSGQTTAKQDSASTNTAKIAPGPETFGQYEKYKDNNVTLTGDIVVGGGDELKAGYQAAVYYKGWLTNGHMFDQSRTGSDGKLQAFILTIGAHQVIRGWEEGLLGMKVGGTRRIIVPPAYGYGANVQGSIPANSVLVFDIQLLEVKAP